MRQFLLLLLTLSLWASPKSEGYVFSALIQDEWKVVVFEDNHYREIDTALEPRTFDYDFINKRIAYIASDKTLRIKNDGKEETVLLRAGIDAYTQPMFNPSGDRIILIKLIEGNSANTDIVSLDPKTKIMKTIVSQRSTQLEPYLLNDANLYYSNVTCVEGCGKIIQEVWYKHILSGDAYQLTLTNTISHQPSVDYDQKAIYFSSNKEGHYHIWKMSLDKHKYTQMTFGKVTDGYPMPTKSGEVLFIRRDGSESKFMKITKTGKIITMELPQRYTKIRNLKVER